MAIELQRLMEKAAHMDVTLVAGKGGMHHLVSWVHMIETMEASDFLEGRRNRVYHRSGTQQPGTASDTDSIHIS